MKSKVALLVGGSGMLADFTTRLATEYDIVGVVGRSQTQMDAFADVPNIKPLIVDYANSQKLRETLEAFQKQHGKPALVVSWIHQTAPEAFGIFTDYCEDMIFEIVSHDAKDENHRTYTHEKYTSKRNIAYHRIILGRNGDRWLTHKEICDGVYKALRVQLREFVVGTL